MKAKFFLFFNSLRFRLVLLVLLAVVPALIVTYSSGIEQRRLARVKAVDDAFRLTRLVAMYHMSLIENTRQLLAFLSMEENLRDPDICNLYLNRLEKTYSVYSAFTVAGPQGQLFCSSASNTNTINISDRKYFQSALLTKSFTIGEPVIGRITKKTVIPLATPVLDQYNNVTAVIIASLDINQVLKYAISMNLPSSSAILLIDNHGTIIFRYPETETWTGQDAPNTPIIQKILSNQGEGSAEAQGVDGTLRLYAFTPFQSNPESRMFISIGIPSSIAYANANRMTAVNTLWIGISALLAVAAAWFVGDVLLLRIVSLTSERDKAEQKLREVNAGLEERVAKRTTELDRANRQLQNELSERQRVVEMLRLRELELNNLLHLLEQSNRDLQDFAYIASHDLQEPLRKIQAFGERLIKRHSAGLDTEGKDFAERMIASANRMQLMINDLLDYSRISSKGHEFQQADLNDILHQVLSDLELRIHETNAQIENGNLPTIEADPLQMQQLFQNLIANAIKFHRPNVPPHVRVCVEPVPPDEPESEKNIRVIVSDNGIGFDEKYLSRIFQPFQRLHNRNDYEGSGIGLAICRKITERHNGMITANSMIGQGSKFVLTLPKAQPKKT